MESLYSLIYFSERIPIELTDVDDILEESLRNNSQDNITGALIADQRYFYQILEGPKAPVLQCYARICADERHRNVTIIHADLLLYRSFEDWQMLYIPNDKIDPKLVHSLLGRKILNITPQKITSDALHQIMVDVRKRVGEKYE